MEKPMALLSAETDDDVPKARDGDGRVGKRKCLDHGGYGGVEVWSRDVVQGCGEGRDIYLFNGWRVRVEVRVEVEA
jgi:hypothetical protein